MMGKPQLYVLTPHNDRPWLEGPRAMLEERIVEAVRAVGLGCTFLVNRTPGASVVELRRQLQAAVDGAPNPWELVMWLDADDWVDPRYVARAAVRMLEGIGHGSPKLLMPANFVRVELPARTLSHVIGGANLSQPFTSGALMGASVAVAVRWPDADPVTLDGDARYFAELVRLVGKHDVERSVADAYCIDMVAPLVGDNLSRRNGSFEPYNERGAELPAECLWFLDALERAMPVAK